MYEVPFYTKGQEEGTYNENLLCVTNFIFLNSPGSHGNARKQLI